MTVEQRETSGDKKPTNDSAEQARRESRAAFRPEDYQVGSEQMLTIKGPGVRLAEDALLRAFGSTITNLTDEKPGALLGRLLERASGSAVE